jgi:hypothetical protein
MFFSVQRLPVLALLPAGAIGEAPRAAEFRSRPAHVHGLASVDIAIDGFTMAVNFRAPAINVI